MAAVKFWQRLTEGLPWIGKAQQTTNKNSVTAVATTVLINDNQTALADTNDNNVMTSSCTDSDVHSMSSCSLSQSTTSRWLNFDHERQHHRHSRSDSDLMSFISSDETSTRASSPDIDITSQHLRSPQRTPSRTPPHQFSYRADCSSTSGLQLPKEDAIYSPDDFNGNSRSSRTLNDVIDRLNKMAQPDANLDAADVRTSSPPPLLLNVFPLGDDEAVTKRSHRTVQEIRSSLAANIGRLQRDRAAVDQAFSRARSEEKLRIEQLSNIRKQIAEARREILLTALNEVKVQLAGQSRRLQAAYDTILTSRWPQLHSLSGV